MCLTEHVHVLRVVIIAGALSNTIASSLKLIGYTRNGYIFQLIGNGFRGLGQASLFFILPTLAATWFGKTEGSCISNSYVHGYAMYCT